MKNTKTDSDNLRELLPELYGPADVKKKNDGMCAPGSGCGPSPQKPGTDILELLKEAAEADQPLADKSGKQEDCGRGAEKEK